MTAMLTENLPLLASAPNGAQKLRELILELAIRGKLLEQNSNDEPASELLKRIAVEKALLIEQKVIRKGKPLPDIEKDETIFNLPKGWVWIRLGQIGDWGAGATPARGNSSYFGGEIPWFKSGELIADFISDSEEHITELALKECSLRQNKPGDVLIAMYGATIGKTAILSVAGTTNQAVCACTAFNGVFNRYLLLTLKALKSNFIGQGAGGAQPNISREKIVATVAGLPPLVEQHRIVSKVDELMVLCDRLEAQQADAESAHDQLVQALLNSLTQASDATDFAVSWQRLAEHFHTLFNTESSIDALKQTLLQMAVMGKLIPQDPNDEPAKELLNRITQEKTQLMADGRIKKQKPLAEITEEERPFTIPTSWSWSRIGELALSTEYGLSEKTSDLLDGVPVLKMGDIQRGQVILGGQMKVSRTTEGLPELYLESEDLLYNRTNSAELVGKTGIFCGAANEFTFASYLIRIRCLKTLFSPAYLNVSMNTPAFRETQINPHLKQQCGQANVNGTIMKNMLISVPPVAEQHRIVAKVDQLMAICDQLKTRLAQARQINEQLASTLVEQAVA
ncbi:restriction endonuclease subunit S [Pseudomonas sp. NFX15]|uniref:restriction endonuclease subunit S n=1 Tax=Pseudomonas sp. NFX15 TaxID=2816958 RepID=UPI003B8EA341